jgi:predicted ribosome quality control (RQC) complex YloA/Tae2 family protein
MKNETIWIPSIATDVEYVVGTSQKEHFDIIDESNPGDIWFHAKHDSSCHVICRMPSVGIDRKHLHSVIKAGALLCKQHTNKLKSTKNVAIIYTHIRNITKTDVAGRVIALETKDILV